MNSPDPRWATTTHAWTSAVDLDHLAEIRECPLTYAPNGVTHLVLEVLAYAAEEAEARGGGRCAVVLHDSGAISVTDDGRGTDTRVDESSRVVRKPVLATRDLRFFDAATPPPLPDGHPRRGMSVVAALSDWLVHVNRRREGAWAQRYLCGVPTTDLEPVRPDGATGTSVCFLAATAVRDTGSAADQLEQMVTSWPALSVEVLDHRAAPNSQAGSECRARWSGENGPTGAGTDARF